MPLCETRWYKWWYFENNAWAVMSWEPHMLKSCGVLSVWDSAHMWPEKRVSACLPDTFIWLQLSGGIDNLKPSHVHWAAWSIKHQLKSFPIKTCIFLTFSQIREKQLSSIHSEVTHSGLFAWSDGLYFQSLAISNTLAEKLPYIFCLGQIQAPSGAGPCWACCVRLAVTNTEKGLFFSWLWVLIDFSPQNM